MATDSPDLMKNINLYTQESQQTPRRINMNRFTLRHIIVTLLKEKNHESNKVKTTHTGIPNKI